VSERRSSDTLEKILEVAETAFAREGYEGAHLQHIAGLVGVQKTALYYYFPSKAALYEAVLRRILLALDETIRNGVESPGGHAERLHRLHDSINDLLAERRNYAQILIRIFVDRPDVNNGEIQPLVEGLVARLMAFFKEGMDAGVFRHGSARHLFQTAMGTLVFHYATGDLGAAILGVEDIYSSQAVSWRRHEVRRTLLRGLLADPDADSGA
jgi:AcrR family transcriptional regulator